MNNKILITGDVFDFVARQYLKSLEFDVITRRSFESENDFRRSLKGVSNYILAGDEYVSLSVISSPEASELKVIYFFGAQWETFFSDDAREFITEKNLTVIPVASNENAVAEFTLGLMLDLIRGISWASKAMFDQEWSQFRGQEIEGKIVGVVGAGRVGILVAKKAKALGTTVKYTNRSQSDALENEGIERLEINDLLTESDIVTLHVPYIPGKTESMIGEKQFGMMKKEAFLINTARPQIVNREALEKAIEMGMIAGYAADGWYTEGNEFQQIDRAIYDPENLMRRSNVLVTPHMGFNTREANSRVSWMIVEEIKKRGAKAA